MLSRVTNATRLLARQALKPTFLRPVTCPNHIQQMRFSTEPKKAEAPKVETPVVEKEQVASEEKTNENTNDEKTTDTSDEKPKSKYSKYVNGAVDLFIGGSIGYLLVTAADFLTDFPPVCEQALNMAAESPFMIEYLGTPLQRRLLWWGTANNDYAKISMDVYGPKGEGRVDCKAIRLPNGEWELLYLHGALPQFDNRLTDLLPPRPEDNVGPYIPQHDDPNANHNLRGAPGLIPMKAASDSQ